jgi:DNA modification methylase
MKSNTADKIKKRTSPNDKFYTPTSLVISHLELIREYVTDPSGIIYEPFSGQGAYLNQFSQNGFNNRVVSTELDKGENFFDFNEQVDYIISNPPYSFIDNVLEKSVSLQPKMISYLIGVNNLTAKRIEYMNKNGYFLTKLKMCKVYKWFGMSFICVFIKGEKNCIEYDRVVYR